MGRERVFSEKKILHHFRQAFWYGKGQISGQICNYCKWHHLVAKFATVCKLCYVVAKFNPSHGVNFWVCCASGNVFSFNATRLNKVPTQI